MAKLKELISITGGQILNRVTCDETKDDPIIDENRRTIYSKTVDKGRIDDDNIVYNNYKTELDDKKITKEGDIIIKLSAPYYATIIDKEHEGMLVASFCSIIRDVTGINKDYLLAYLNSSLFNEQVLKSVAGTTVGVLPIGKIMDFDIPVPTEEKQIEIAKLFMKTVKRKALIERIIKLEEEKLEVLFAKLGD